MSFIFEISEYIKKSRRESDQNGNYLRKPRKEEEASEKKRRKEANKQQEEAQRQKRIELRKKVFLI